MREVGLFFGCLLLALGFWSWNRDRLVDRSARDSERMLGLGAADGLTPSPERLLLSGDFLSALQATPSPRTYQRVARVFLVGHDLKGKEVEAYAFSESLMVRVLGGSLEFFNRQGSPLQATLRKLDGSLSKLELSALKPKPEIELRAEGDWIVGQQPEAHFAFRADADGGVIGFTASTTITVEKETLKVEEGGSWRWNGQALEPVQSP